MGYSLIICPALKGWYKIGNGHSSKGYLILQFEDPCHDIYTFVGANPKCYQELDKIRQPRGYDNYCRSLHSEKFQPPIHYFRHGISNVLRAVIKSLCFGVGVDR